MKWNTDHFRCCYLNHRSQCDRWGRECRSCRAAHQLAWWEDRTTRSVRFAHPCTGPCVSARLLRTTRSTVHNMPTHLYSYPLRINKTAELLYSWMRYKTHILRRNLAMSILGPSAQMQKATISSGMSACQPARLPACPPARLPSCSLSRLSTCMFVCLSVHMQQLGSHWTDFHEIRYLRIFLKLVEKIQVSLISDMNNGQITWRSMCIYDNISLISFWIRYVQSESRGENPKHILCSITFLPENCAVSETMWKKYCTVGQATDDNITRRVRFVCWINKSTDTHSEM